MAPNRNRDGREVENTMGRMKSRAISVLLVEDNQGDVLLVRQALNATDTSIELHVARDGVAGLEFVRRKNPKPDLIILDLNLPQKSGCEVLQELKADAELSEIPVVVFSTSGARCDVRAAYRAHASSYVQKPHDVDAFFAVVADLKRYWTETVLLPSY
jgi:chemotaxis family two-component system response regulator Rcp1